jgi:hypothetical protein
MNRKEVIDMKNAILRRAGALLLALVLTLSVSACGGGVADSVQGFVNAITHMDGEQNTRSEMTMSFKFSESARPMPFAQFLTEVVNVSNSRSGMADMERLLLSTEFGVTMVAEVYEDTAFTSIGWAGPYGPETVMSFAVTDANTVYIGTEILRYLGGIAGAAGIPQAELNMVLSMIDCDYIKIDISGLTGMMNSLGGLGDLGGMGMPDFGFGNNFGMEMPDEIQAALDKAGGTFMEVLREYTPKILTEEHRDILKSEGGGFTLTLNTEKAIALIGEILHMAAEYENEIRSFLLDIGGPLGIQPYMLNGLNLRDAVSAFERETANIVIGKDIPDFNLVYKVSGTGSGAQKRQTNNLSLMIPVDDPSVPFDKLFINADSVTTITRQRVAAPSGRTLSLEELLGSAMMNFGMGNMFGGVPQFGGDDYYNDIAGGMGIFPW